ncbi:MAG: type II toxin-antitoxin system VapC family toxin [Proteobacteria bacterium]|nr:type II toxin-antitoxin system VapC family toxin [Pseudomonadota bacterium]
MAFLLDTCVLSDGIKHKPNTNLLAWLDGTPQEQRFVSVLSLAEIQFGILMMPDGRRKTVLASWYETELRPSCDSRVLSFNEPEATMWARLRASQPSASFVDTQLAATALIQGLTIVTRNVRDFDFDGLAVINPWEV